MSDALRFVDRIFTATPHRLVTRHGRYTTPISPYPLPIPALSAIAPHFHPTVRALDLQTNHRGAQTNDD